MQILKLQILFKSIHFYALVDESVIFDQKFCKIGYPSTLSQHYLQTISRVSPEYLQNNDYQNSNIKKVGGINLKQICKINILAHDTGAENYPKKITNSFL